MDNTQLEFTVSIIASIISSIASYPLLYFCYLGNKYCKENNIILVTNGQENLKKKSIQRMAIIHILFFIIALVTKIAEPVTIISAIIELFSLTTLMGYRSSLGHYL